MSGISQATGIPAARHALHNAAKVALEGEAVDVTFGFRWPFEENDWFALTDVSADIDAANIGPSRQQREQITLSVSVVSWMSGHDEATEVAVFDRAFSLLSKVQEHIRTKDITLDKTVLWCVPGSVQSAGATTDEDSGEGRLIEIAATFVCEHRIKTTS